MKRFLLFVALLGSIFTFTGCGKDAGDDDIEGYLKKNNITALKTADGLYYVIDVPGNQLKKPKVNSDIKVAYKGTLLNGNKFDENANFTTNLSNVIAGWRRGMVLFGEGGKGKLIIPSSLGYGDQPVGDIPASSALVFDVELLQVIN
jgi:FKBP-type peptidyl-prolyl cis-trans isomerase FkpA